MRTRLLAALLALLPATAAAQREISIERFEADITVLKSGQLRVSERITARFQGQWNGVYRSIPINYETPQRLNYRLRVDLIDALGADGNPLRVESETRDGALNYKIYIPNALDTTHTIVLQYRVANGLRFFEEHDELYWNVTGDRWDVPLKFVNARIILPSGVTGVRATSFTGAAGAQGSVATVSNQANGVDIVVPNGLGFREGLTAVVGWDPGVVSRPSVADKAAFTLLSNLVFILPLLALFIMWRVWNRHGRDPERRSIATAYEPPADLRPAEIGTLIDHKPDIRDITSTIVDLAVRGYLVIEERTDQQLFGLLSSTGYTFRLKRDRSQWNELRNHERLLLDGLFKSGRDSVDDDDLENRFYKELPGIKNSLFDQMIEQGFYRRRPDNVIGVWMLIAVVSGGAVAFLGIALNTRLGSTAPVGPIIAGALTAIIVAAFGVVMPARTVRGARTLEQALGFEEFLRQVESDRFDRVIKTPELFETYLPFAMALQLDSNWCRAFEDIYTTPPNWYAGSRGQAFSLRSFNSSMSRMTTSTASAMTSAPRSSSSGSSGFGGGGRSGGGFGGGGGGGF
ncbi:MAG: DUF2207 domain-containing protein [Gemmatimonadota bacterium]